MLRAMGRLPLISLLLALALAGCATQSIALETGTRSFTADDYERVYDAWTRDQTDFAWTRMNDVLLVTATYEAWEFRWAYVVRYARDHSLEDDARTAMLRATLDDARRNHRFFVTLSGPVFREQNLASERSAWRVLLVDEDGRQTTPAEIQRVRRPTAAEQVYFPTVGPHRQAFRIVFPVRREDGSETIPADSSWVVLRFAGARGQLDLKWVFGEEGEADEPTVARRAD